MLLDSQTLLRAIITSYDPCKYFLYEKGKFQFGLLYFLHLIDFS